MSNNPDQLENQQDQEKEEKRHVLFIPLVIIGLLLVLSVAGYAVASGMGAFTPPTQEPTEEATEVAEVTETDEPTEEVVNFTPVPTEAETDAPTPTVTQTLTPTAAETDEPTDEPTPTRPARTSPTLTPTNTPVCGDFVCNGSETAASCAKDCGCFEDNVCTSAEQAIGTCRDCSATAGTCGAPCQSNAQCNTAAGYTCDTSTNYCDAPFCDPPPPTEPTTEPVSCSCGEIICNGCDCATSYSCTDGTTQSIEFYCEDGLPTACTAACTCNGTTLDCPGEDFDDDYAPQCVVGSSNCYCSYWYSYQQGISAAAQQSACSDPDELGYMVYNCFDPSDNSSGQSYIYDVTCGEAETNSCFSK